MSGPLNRLLAGLGLDDKLPPIPTVARVAVMPVTVAVPISRTTPNECVCPTCRIFEKEAQASMCPRCTLRGEVRAMNAARRQEHYDSIDRELRERDAMRNRAEHQVRRDAGMIQKYSDRVSLIAQLDEFDCDWRSHYGTIEQAEAAYLRQREPL